MRNKRRQRKEHYVPTTDAELDLHGCNAEEARTEVRDFLTEAGHKNWNRIRIVVGKGTHSEHGAVLPFTIKNLLTEMGYTYTYAKLQNGGEGALEVQL